ncbi:MAG: glucans biosynthesis glucosyltransferase MdoH [Hyphomicrobiaceae bacterium]|nr:glucans biosynthesis glucosyltransferase MdoH [Hyphomicrobiaceae bacterium]
MDRLNDASFAWMPPPARLAMPDQNLCAGYKRPRPLAQEPHAARAARLFLALLTLALTAGAVSQAIEAVAGGPVTFLQWVFVGFFAITFAWVAFATSSSLAAIFTTAPKDPRDAGPALSVALVMPVYNEASTHVAAALEAMAGDGLIAARHRFEIVILADTTDPEAWARETLVFHELRQRLCGRMPVWYRRRWKNAAKKAGNLRQFVEHWGARYDAMIVLDADSVMSGATLIALADRMAATPDAGLIQTVPRLAGQISLFARLQQFAGGLYGPVMARGVASWSGRRGNYWGHNAILRMRAFAEAAGLPQLKGAPPFGGLILSHDFVEAALLVRAGWAVELAHDLTGSYEESPPGLAETALRDRRWAQGNLQHARIIGAGGLSLVNRTHMAVGILAYLSSPLWLVMILVGVALSVQALFFRPEYFTDAFQLFPEWPTFDAPRMRALFASTLLLLFLPRLVSLAAALVLKQRRRTHGGALRLIAGFLLETFLSALIAPVMMLIHTRHILSILSGRDSGWGTQARKARAGSLLASIAKHRLDLFVGALVTVAIAPIAPEVFWWLLPVVCGWLLSPLTDLLLSSERIGGALAGAGILATAEETALPPVLEQRSALITRYEALAGIADPIRTLALDPEAARRHLGSVIARPLPHRGAPNAAHLMAEAKIGDARNLDEALGWLERTERLEAIADPVLMQALCDLPAARRLTSAA